MATSSSSSGLNRYLASDFKRLTNRSTRRFTTPGFTPDLAHAQEPPHAERSSKAPAAILNVTTSDKRAHVTSSLAHQDDQSGPRRPMDIAHGGNKTVSRPSNSSSRDSSLAGSSGQLDACVKEDNSAVKTVSKRSKSYTNLRTGISELSGWDLEFPRRKEEDRPVKKKEYGSGEAPLEKLPSEVLDDVIANLAIDLPPSGYAPRNVDLIACLLTSKTLHVATINTLYKQITIPHSQIFSKFLSHLNEYQGLGTLVRRLDLSHFTSVGLGRSRQTNSEIQNLTPRTLVKCLELTPWVQEILLQENLDDDVDSNVLKTVLVRLPKLRALDLCACSSQPFVESFSSVMRELRDNPSTMLGLKRLSLHECFTLPGSAFETLLPRLTQLSHLDVSHTRITDMALASLPISARLTHLNLGRCTTVTGEGVVDFLTSHPAAKSLVYLNLSCDISRYRLLWEADVDRLLPALPTTLRSLNLNGAHIHPHHIRHLLPLTKHVEELGLATANLSLEDVNNLFRPNLSSLNSQDQDNEQAWVPSNLHYLDLTAIPSITQSSLFNTPQPSNILLTPQTVPLEVIELGDKTISSLRECRNTNKRLGWCVKELGRRGWYVREPVNSANGSDSGSTTSSNSSSSSLMNAETGQQRGSRRSWKMGAMWWGMRKVPVAWSEVGGLYGHYMFKK
ncbi:uncharacterized protein KY384_004295 [Bacidia gigantensis]|uniref:uncharacterized protein n=1 Tax=Bacidia gigantensis TaxID=2732470 RepID=UPI001D035F3E|nr:uncharacterized protein KY384_004295 [Bacidia gigantensis]KAG8530938.1 hypothetical protein KY384_004295 [Bacidia gigantensis]